MGIPTVHRKNGTDYLTRTLDTLLQVEPSTYPEIVHIQWLTMDISIVPRKVSRLLDVLAEHPAAGRLVHARHLHKATLLENVCEEMRSSPRPMSVCRSIVLTSSFFKRQIALATER